MSNKSREAKLNALLKKNNGNLNYSSLKTVSGGLKPQQPKKVSFNKTAKVNVEMTRSKDNNYSKAQIYPKYGSNNNIKFHSTEALDPIKFREPVKDTYSPDVAQDGLQASDEGLPTSMNGEFVMMNNKLVKPELYNKMAQRNDYFNSGYRAALLLNLNKVRQSPINQTTDELKNRRQQISIDFISLLKKIGNESLKNTLGQIANNVTSDKYVADGIVNKVMTDLPSSVISLPNDPDSMQALISGLNNTSKKALIIDEIYINAMLTMYLNDYNRKNERNTSFLLMPYAEIKQFTDSESMFSMDRNIFKIRSLDEFDFSGCDFIYVDTTLMKPYTFHVLVNLMKEVNENLADETNSCQIVVRTNIDLGANEQEFYRNMGLIAFGEIFASELGTEVVSAQEAFNALTGRTNNDTRTINNNLNGISTGINGVNTRLNGVNVGLARSNVELGRSNNELGRLSTRVQTIDENMTTRELARQRSEENARAAEAEKIAQTIRQLNVAIATSNNAATRSYQRNEIGLAREQTRHTEKLKTAKIIKEIEYATLTGQNTEEFYNQLQPTEVPEVRKLIAEGEAERKRIRAKEEEREGYQEPYSATSPVVDISHAVPLVAQEAIPAEQEIERILSLKYKKSFMKLLRKIPPENKFTPMSDQYDHASSNFVRDVLLKLIDHENILTTKYCTISFAYPNRIEINTVNIDFTIENLYKIIDKLVSDMKKEMDLHKMSQGYKMLKELKDGINKWYEDFREEVRTYMIKPSINQGAKPQAYFPPQTPPSPPPHRYSPPQTRYSPPPPGSQNFPSFAQRGRQGERYDNMPHGRPEEEEEFKLLNDGQEYILKMTDQRKYDDYIWWKNQQQQQQRPGRPTTRSQDKPKDKPKEKPQGKGIAGYVRGGSIESFVDKAYSLLHIKNIKRYNKSTFIINL
jgi:hypothetical protein